jgi:hypothetical protein
MSKMYQLRRPARYMPGDGIPYDGQPARLRSATPLARRQMLIEPFAVTPR